MMSESEGPLLIASLAARSYDFNVTSFRILSGGRINDNYRVETSEGPRLLRVYPLGRSRSQIEFEHSLLSHLHSLNCAVPLAYLARDGSLIGTVQGRNFVWMQLIEALPLTAVQARNLPLEELRALLHPVFEGLMSFDPPFNPVRETRVFARRMPALLSSLRKEDDLETEANIERLFKNLQAWERQVVLPHGVIHADIHAGNVLKHSIDSRLWLIDFDDAHVGTRAIDWGLAALEFSLDEELRVDEERYMLLLNELSRGLATDEEKGAASKVRVLLTLKFAASLASLGDTPAENHFLQMLKQRATDDIC